MQIFVLLLSVVVFTGCVTLDNITVCRQHKAVLKQIESINISDGIDNQEASFLAQQYFVNYVGGCGAVGKPIDKGDSWGFEAVIGYVAKKMDGLIYVDKKSGAISFNNYPTLTGPIPNLLEKQKELIQKLNCE